jgi:uncharacterized protein YcnI
MNYAITARRVLAPAAVALVTTLGLAGPASAHVTVSADTTAAGAYAVLTVSVPHGCEGSPTTEVAIQIPDDILSVTPTRNPLWDVKVTTEKLAKPVKDAHGNAVSERDATVTYTTTTPLPDHERDAFELSVKLPEDEGETLVFPAIQTCEEGQTAWTQVAASGQDPEKLEHPAPSVTLTAAEGDAHGAPAQPSAEHETASDQSTTLTWLALGTGALGLVVGLIALARSRRTA